MTSGLAEANLASLTPQYKPQSAELPQDSPELALKPIQRFTESAVCFANNIGSSFFTGIEATLAHLRGEPVSIEDPEISPPSTSFTPDPYPVDYFRPADSQTLADSLVLDACESRGVQLRPSEAFMDALARKLRALDFACVERAFVAAFSDHRCVRRLQRAVLVLDALEQRGMDVNFVSTVRCDLGQAALLSEARVKQVVSRWGLLTTDQAASNTTPHTLDLQLL